MFKHPAETSRARKWSPACEPPKRLLVFLKAHGNFWARENTSFFSGKLYGYSLAPGEAFLRLYFLLNKISAAGTYLNTMALHKSKYIKVSRGMERECNTDFTKTKFNGCAHEKFRISM